MPAWGGRIPEYQIWQIMAFIQSMNGKQPTSAKEEYSCARED
jgi:cytochrome c oxidase cbb3-type subunit 3